MSEATLLKVIDARLNGSGAVITEEAKRAGLDLALVCAIVEQESQGENVFGCDFGDVGDVPPYCGQDVTPDRVTRLRHGGDYTWGMNGIGLTQLTWWEFVEKAEALGGAHVPRWQCRVAFELLASYLKNNEYMWALELYNGDDGKPGSPYANSVAAKHEGWKTRLGVNVADYPTTWIKPNAKKWMVDAKGNYVRAQVPVAADASGWLYTPEGGKKKWSWPVANATPMPDSANYQDRCPTRYSWRDEVEAWARYLVDNYSVWCNTYHHHPESVWLESGVSREYDSIDVWGPAGRNDPIDPSIGQTIFNLLFNDSNPPNIEWIIWEEVIYGAWNGWNGESFGDGSTFTAHRDHLHVTYLR